MNSLEYYKNNTIEYINSTIELDNTVILNILRKQIHSIDDKILDIGFGSGRELISLFTSGYNNLYGIDGNNLFVKELYSKINAKLYCNTLPNITINDKFDLIYSVATIFHLNEEERKILFGKLYKILNKNGSLILSYNEEDRSNDKERLFYKLNKDEIEKVMLQVGFKLKERIITDDINKRFNWINDIYIK